MRRGVLRRRGGSSPPVRRRGRPCQPALGRLRGRDMGDELTPDGDSREWGRSGAAPAGVCVAGEGGRGPPENRGGGAPGQG